MGADSSSTVIFRGGVQDCHNWITNGDFSNHIYNGLQNCDKAFQNNLVPDWTSSNDDPDLWYSECEQVLGSLLASQDCAILSASDNPPFSEAIDQALVETPPHAADVLYHLCFLADGTNGDSPLLVTTYGSSSELVVDQQIESTGNVGRTYDVEFTTSGPFNRISFASEPDAQGVVIDNIVLTCSSTNFQTILFDAMQSSCQFAFEPYIEGPLTVVSYEWDFGDGNTSTLENPTHTYSTPGAYRVSLTIVDDRKCCTKREVEVECTDKPLCYSYICWEDFIGHHPCAVGVKFLLPSGIDQYVPFVDITSGSPTCSSTQEYPIPASVLINGGYCDIHEQLEYAAQSIGYHLSVHRYDRFGFIDCYKAGVPDSGIFTVSQDGLKILNIKVQGEYAKPLILSPAGDTIQEYEPPNCILTDDEIDFYRAPDPTCQL